MDIRQREDYGFYDVHRRRTISIKQIGALIRQGEGLEAVNEDGFSITALIMARVIAREPWRYPLEVLYRVIREGV